MKRIITLVTSIALILGVSAIAQGKNNYSVSRIEGANRYKTSLNISKQFNNDKVDNVIIASGSDFPDALAGSSLSKKLKAPILLVDKDIKGSLDSIDYIKNHLNTNRNVYILGGNASVSEDYVNYIKSLGYKNIIRLGGKNRFDTNRTIINSMNIEKGTPIVITNGYGFADALSVSSAAASKGYPILMSDSKTLPNEIKDKIREIQPSKVYLIGGQGSLTDNIMTEVRNIVPSLNNNIIRLWGNNRYDTSLEICKYFNLDSDIAVIANGENFPDALSGSALAAKQNAPIVLTNGKDMLNQKKYLNTTNYKNLILLGGSGAISSNLENILNGTINELDIIKSKSVYNSNMKDNNGDIYSAYLYSDDKKIEIAEYSWAGAQKGDILSTGHYKIAIVKQGESEPEIYDVYDNKPIKLNLNRNSVKVYKNKQSNGSDFLMIGMPVSSNISEIKLYYIKDGEIKKTYFKDKKSIKNEAYTFNSLFFNQREADIFETSTYDNMQTFLFYVHSWKFNLEDGVFYNLGFSTMNQDTYFNYEKKVQQ
ncbi:cell wall-binding repeat-containing protein [Clostridium botulinum]|uniref:cell wall-binding repeat-containing protein n=1 Tax=Clostridium botulinum TaxID=1491 RepID=UPI0007735D52|nr:cell wall-binding repeat-containing protein [Clostridium botulinum]APH21515.1 cell wall binding repeat 2 family protein [Clostridium botulinum]APQ69092.1 cell wall binding repeat 2 family protein [Clostridium botulinum]MBN3377534.1 cell wall-binding repeat-containing protein [Clostridium botulinum]MBN3404634.1 cell wall-binding repeat-containing protein [Clostridium botulinum]QDY17864.1 cell wall-binding repeat-containing protein [Clostridium botulinum]